MKKNYLAMAAMAIGLLTFSACSSDDDFGGEQTTTAKGEMQDVELTFNIGVNSGKETRADVRSGVLKPSNRLSTCNFTSSKMTTEPISMRKK